MQPKYMITAMSQMKCGAAAVIVAPPMIMVGLVWIFILVFEEKNT